MSRSPCNQKPSDPAPASKMTTPQAEGFDPEGMIGEIQQLKVISTKHRGEFFTANRPVFVQFKVSRSLLHCCNMCP